MKKLFDLQSLRDPIWQATGVVVGIFAIVISTLVTYDIYRRSSRSSDLTINEQFTFDPLQFGETLKGRVALMIDGTAVQSVVAYYYSLSNTGQNPIYPSDYIKSIRVSVDTPWELLAIETESSKPSGLLVKWTKVMTNTFEMEPYLLNPEDTINVLLFTTNPTRAQEPPKLSWSARIANVHSLKVQPQQTAAERSGLGVFFIGVNHYGWSVYLLGGLAVLLFAIAMLLGKSSGRLPSAIIPQTLLLAVIMALSFTSAEIIVDTLIEHKEQWPGAWFFIALHSLIFGYLIWPLIRKTKLREQTPQY